MQDTITIRGFVATDPAVRHTASGTTVAGFRLATTERRFDRDAGTWVDAHTNWYSVSAFGQLGSNTAQSIKKGNPVIVTGRLRVRDWSTEERSGTSVDVVADAVGLDLGYGSGAFVRNQRASAPREEPLEERAAGAEPAEDFGGPAHDAFAPARADRPADDGGEEQEGDERVGEEAARTPGVLTAA
ncbi:single-stranded DNA-binding protein [Micrococcus sp. EYE_162]|uniref:single-stranded DNA-binding protein n=1 Tax=unclassified Micrococcus TaxID=2620948 RepID=UPI0020059832|nr:MULTISPECIES: single-stranded DNA-binding protein [unclassified Micrococcus]MCK6094302.1 single-stranded DNA-binding protein [Micrococcus sp. EYE_212]MCK6170483.1 single-stranded DNA-binding protein [Micrococcus sp. EYE_162]